MTPYYFRLTQAAILMLLFLVTGCKSGNQRAPSTIEEGDSAEIRNRIETFKQVYHLCPSPAEMLSVIDMAGLSFEGDLLNPVINADRYLDTRSRTLNLGVYITDLAYSALFGRHVETLDYLEVVRTEAEQIQLTGAIDDELIQKARDNVEYLDSLFNISNEAFINMLFFCERNNRPNTIVLLSAGTFIESLFLAVNLVDDYESATNLLQHLAEQKYAIDNLMIFAESLSGEDENIAAVVQEMKPLKEIFDSIDLGAGAIVIKKQGEETGGQPKKLVIGGAASKLPALSREQFNELKEETIRLRTSLVEV